MNFEEAKKWITQVCREDESVLVGCGASIDELKAIADHYFGNSSNVVISSYYMDIGGGVVIERGDMK